MPPPTLAPSERLPGGLPTRLAAGVTTGLGELAAWLEGQVADDRVEAARRELTARGLTL